MKAKSWVLILMVLVGSATVWCVYKVRGMEIFMASIGRSEHLHQSMEGAMRVYKSGDSKGAVEKLEALVNELEQDREWVGTSWLRRRWSFLDSQTLTFDIGLTHARLANKYKELGNEQNYSKQMDLACHNMRQHNARFQDGREVSTFVKQLDAKLPNN